MSRRQEEEIKRSKRTAGYWVWRVGFLLFYPFIAVFTFVFTVLLNGLSAISQGLAWLLGGRKA
ncbi:MAG: hypothetical protein EAZ32_06970 [Cytophagia bacterium]|jgi:cellulose synthase/poly-beta-1,6-N-acetylglucosamine synthase-like glycosyltransferase|nr:MAG: hypothetical protein EAZ46_07205 [Runella sp.]TAG21236.1 MAG: hypothetical protein EAZ38_08550 [Cytophagales bacterium]TAG40327.1 MAG: hypothetical protein EAZ32_06970 [Cytophagia bacterium]TAG51307.1 MAG: hypothetical protein EAZ29_10070 [Runella slithyformis]TAG81886.1 MAG: hypothetical protein EAZ22_06325 [Cytophagales bacterium]